MIGMADAEGSDLFAVFISNEKKQALTSLNGIIQVPLWHQKASKRADGIILWDYHVICIQIKKEGSSPPQVWDLDSSLPFPSHLDHYMSDSFGRHFSFFPIIRGSRSGSGWSIRLPEPPCCFLKLNFSKLAGIGNPIEQNCHICLTDFKKALLWGIQSTLFLLDMDVHHPSLWWSRFCSSAGQFVILDLLLYVEVFQLCLELIYSLTYLYEQDDKILMEVPSRMGDRKVKGGLIQACRIQWWKDLKEDFLLGTRGVGDGKDYKFGKAEPSAVHGLPFDKSVCMALIGFSSNGSLYNLDEYIRMNAADAVTEVKDDTISAVFTQKYGYW
ncbi:Protein N-terminal glutamine amidohydrolase [Vitis vinifera]|uniref:Protein N-terminal glutamine amidohydrolase n=1 Tax=Vitis vinifera TaxID=29760 RepID=A0A438JKT8_VITVI|nr:Protein N-terminal glutamine amidohydrolase [Vitis vinifera]